MVINSEILVCPKCGLLTLIPQNCVICNSVLISTGETFASASKDDFPKTLHEIKGRIQSGEQFNRKLWKMRKKEIRKRLIAQKESEDILENDPDFAVFVEKLEKIKVEDEKHESSPIRGGLVTALFNTVDNVNSSSGSLTKYINAYLETSNKITDDNCNYHATKTSLLYITKYFRKFINSQYLAGQQEGG